MPLLEILFSLLTLTALEAILGIDNLVFISILSSRLPEAQQKRARRAGLALAWISRLLLLVGAIWMTRLTQPLFQVFQFSVSWHDLFLFSGGLFLMTKGTIEIHSEMEAVSQSEHKIQYGRYFSVIVQIALFDIIFSLDSILTAIGLTRRYWVMATAITIAIALMILASEPMTRFIQRHPTIKMLALSFLLLIGTTLIANAFHFDIPHSYIYFAVSFSLLVEFLNVLARDRKKRADKKRISS